MPLFTDPETPHKPAMLAMTPEMAWLWFCSMAYCAAHHTDGFIPHVAVPGLSPQHGRMSKEQLDEIIRGLVEISRAWHDREQCPECIDAHRRHKGQPAPAYDWFYVHGFLESEGTARNFSAAEREVHNKASARRMKKSRASRKLKGVAPQHGPQHQVQHTRNGGVTLRASSAS